MSNLFLVPKSEAYLYATGTKVFYMGGVPHLEATQWQDGCILTDDFYFCPYCGSDNCGSNHGAEVCLNCLSPYCAGAISGPDWCMG